MLHLQTSELLILEIAHEVRPETDNHARLRGELDGGLPGLEHLGVLLQGDGGHAHVGAALGHGQVGDEGGDEHRVVFGHEVRSLGVEEVAMLDASDSVGHRVGDRLG